MSFIFEEFLQAMWILAIVCWSLSLFAFAFGIFKKDVEVSKISATVWFLSQIMIAIVTIPDGWLHSLFIAIAGVLCFLTNISVIYSIEVN
jgi:hypothetical protein